MFESYGISAKQLLASDNLYFRDDSPDLIAALTGKRYTAQQQSFVLHTVQSAFFLTVVCSQAVHIFQVIMQSLAQDLVVNTYHSDLYYIVKMILFSLISTLSHVYMFVLGSCKNDISIHSRIIWQQTYKRRRLMRNLARTVCSLCPYYSTLCVSLRGGSVHSCVPRHTHVWSTDMGF